MRHAVIKNNKVVNVIEADEGYVEKGFVVVSSDSADIGDTYESGEFIKPVREPSLYTPSDLEIRIAALEDKTGVTETDREAARHKLIERNTR